MRTSVIVPCWNEEAVLARCLPVLIDDIGRHGPHDVEIVVVPNACTDRTAAVARSYARRAAAAGIDLRVVETPVPGKSGALTLGDAHATGDVRVYLDADVEVGAGLISALAAALATSAARYATGTLAIAATRSWVTRAYGRVWGRLPFVADEGSGCGLYAVNAAGRRRWGAFPGIHSDDKFVRSIFTPAERVRVGALYLWPLPDGWRGLLRVRRRWCEGNGEFRRRYPHLVQNGRHRRSVVPFLRIAALRPLDAVVFAGVYALAAAQAASGDRTEAQVVWRRGRA